MTYGLNNETCCIIINTDLQPFSIETIILEEAPHAKT
jgi:hypothetical protein